MLLVFGEVILAVYFQYYNKIPGIHNVVTLQILLTSKQVIVHQVADSW